MGNDNSEYLDMSAMDALRYVNKRNMLLPDIQREYVWEKEDIEELFESIVDKFPIGTYILWKTTKKNLNDKKNNLYYFYQDFKKNKSENEKAPEYLCEENDESEFYIVLDGQQRITSLNIALYGSYSEFKGGKGKKIEDPSNWIKRELYYNLDYYHSEDEDEEHPTKKFAFLNEEDSKKGNWYKVKNIVKYSDFNTFYRSLMESGYDTKAINDIQYLYRRLFAVKDGGLIHYYCITNTDYDEVLDIFVRVNSTGVKLAKSDLLFSTLINGWDKGKEEIENIIKSMNAKGDGFYFTRDFLMRLAMILVDESAKLNIQSLTKDTIKKIRDNWKIIKDSSEEMAKVITAAGLSKETLTSYNATMPIAYYLYKGGSIKTEEDYKEVKKFLTVSMAKRLFGIASNSALNSTREALRKIDCKKAKFSLSLFSETILTGGRSFIVKTNDIDYWLDNYSKGQSTYLLLSLLYPECKLDQTSFHQDHCHPYDGFKTSNLKKLGIDNEKIYEWQKKRNLLPNLQFLKGKENQSKNKTPLKDWYKLGNKIMYIDGNISLELEDFDLFFSNRRDLMRRELLKLFDIESEEQA